MKLFTFLKSVFLISLIAFFAACSKSSPNPTHVSTPTPSITSLSASEGVYNSSIIITGNHFDPTLSGDLVFFNGIKATITAASTTQLTVTVPLSAGTGNISISVDNGNKIQGPVFTYQLAYFVTTIAGSNQAGEINGTGAAAFLNISPGICSDLSGNVYIVNSELIRKVTPAGVVTSYVGQASFNSANNGTLSSANLGLLVAVTLDPSGNMFIADQAGNIWKVTPTGIVTKFIIPTKLTRYAGLATDAAGNLYVADSYNNNISKISPSGIISILAGSGQPGSANGSGQAASFYAPSGVTVDAAGNVYVADSNNNIIRKITPAGLVTNLGAADFITPQSLTVDATGNVYVADTGEALVKKITPSGDISIIAGTPGNGGNTGVDGIGTKATLYGPIAITIDSHNNLYIGDGNELRRISYE